MKDGIEDAGTLVLLVSQASLASPYVEEEWRGAIKKGHKLVLVVYETVVLPEALQGFPTFDFRTGFQKNLMNIIAYLKEEAEPRYDLIPRPKHIKIASKIPRVIWVVLFAQFSLLLGMILVFLSFLIFHPIQDVLNTIGPGLLSFAFIFFGLGFWHGKSFLRHKLIYK